MYLSTCDKEASILQRSSILRMVLLQREQRQDQVGQEERRRKSPDGYVSVVLWNTTGSQCQSGTLGQQDNRTTGQRKTEVIS